MEECRKKLPMPRYAFQSISGNAAGLVYGILLNSPLQAKHLTDVGAAQVFAGPEELLRVLMDARYSAL